MADANITRRQAIAAGGVFGLGALGLAACGDDEPASTPSSAQPTIASAGTDTTAAAAQCILTPEQTEGPYYLPDSMVRSDIAEDRDGTPLKLVLTVQDADRCEPIQNATVEIWHCDAKGGYSGVGGAGGTFLRGGQKTDRDGVATFETIYPGWYQGRTTHIHVKVHVQGNEVHTGQLYFDDGVTEAVAGTAPYDTRGTPDTTNESDGIYSQGGAESTVKVAKSGDGYTGSLTMGVAT